MSQDKSNSEFMVEKINKSLVGGTITGSLITEDSEGFGFRVVTKRGTFQVWVDRDPESNGPGWLAIEPV